MLTASAYDEFRIFFGFDPRHIAAWLSKSFFDSVKAYIKRIIEKNHSIARRHSQLHCRAVIAVNDPLVLFEHSGQPFKKHTLFYRSLVRIPIHHIKVIQRNACLIM